LGHKCGKGPFLRRDPFPGAVNPVVHRDNFRKGKLILGLFEYDNGEIAILQSAESLEDATLIELVENSNFRSGGGGGLIELCINNGKL